MGTQLLLLLCLIGHVLAKEPPDVDCLVVHLERVHCSWNQQGTPEVNYTFYGRFHYDSPSECPTYLSEDNINTGCNQPYGHPLQRFNTFYTKLVHGDQIYEGKHDLKNKVKLNPPTNVTVQIRNDSNLYFSWTQITKPRCVENEVRYRINRAKWMSYDVTTGMYDYRILPSHNSLYELQVRSRLGSGCGQSVFWSDWSEPVAWGSNNMDVDCLVVHLERVHCSWNQQGTPEVNYTFQGWFHSDSPSECPTYLSENNINTGCNQPYGNPLQRFNTFYTRLVHGDQIYEGTHDLKKKVKLNPPTNVTVQIRDDSNLYFSWTRITKPSCVEDEIRYRINSAKWMSSAINTGVYEYCINLPSHNSLYELQVRSRLGSGCGQSVFWSDWSEPVAWGSNNNSTVSDQLDSGMFVWTTVLSAVSVFILILLVLMLLHNDRIRIIFIPVVPKPSPNLHNVEDWFQFSSKGMKESFNYNERPCIVREYCHVPSSDSESSDCSTCSANTDQTDCSVNTDQTDCSVFIPVSGSDLSTHCSSSTSTSTVPVPPEEEEEKQVSV